MDDIYSKFFSTEKGLTATSANHIANLAKQAYTKDSTFLEKFNLVNESIQLVGEESLNQTKIGASLDDLNSLKSRLENIALLKGLCAWLREAIKAKETLASKYSCYSFFKWCEENNISLPDSSGLEKAVDPALELSIADMADKLYNEAKAATYGGFIHPNQPGDKALKEVTRRLCEPVSVDADGRDTIIRRYEASVEPELVDQVFDELRAEWRSTEAVVNKTNHELDTVYATRKRAYQNEATQIASKRSNLEMEARNKFDEWVESELQRIEKLKIIIPEKFMPVYNHLNSLGKNSK